MISATAARLDSGVVRVLAVVWRIDFGDENRDRAFRGSRRDRRLGSNDELVRGAVEVWHEPTVDDRVRARKTRSVSGYFQPS
jgi:hypothetical protein